MTAPARVLITGARGQVGSALLTSAPLDVEVRGTAHGELDIGDAASVAEYVADFRPQVIINAAAYTAVDKAESEPDLAMRINAGGPANLARSAHQCGARLIHVSTDFVFDGRASSPYRADDVPAPLSVYGASKLAGEREILAGLPDAVIVRTAWVYAAQGNNFVRTMLRLMKERGQVNVISDQVGTPTSARSLACALWAFCARPDLKGVFHWTDAGVASWYDFAVAIAEESTACGLLGQDTSVNPIATRDYPTAAKRPAYSVLDHRATLLALNMRPMHWRVQLRAVLKELSLA